VESPWLRNILGTVWKFRLSRFVWLSGLEFRVCRIPSAPEKIFTSVIAVTANGDGDH
jgi:hypothetical protein